jgi:hypothetical protein
MPLFVLMIGAIIKIGLRRDDGFVMQIMLLGQIIAQLLFLVAKADLGIGFPWKLVFLPTYTICILLAGQYLSDLNKRKWS